MKERITDISSTQIPIIAPKQILPFPYHCRSRYHYPFKVEKQSRRCSLSCVLSIRYLDIISFLRAGFQINKGTKSPIVILGTDIFLGPLGLVTLATKLTSCYLILLRTIFVYVTILSAKVT